VDPVFLVATEAGFGVTMGRDLVKKPTLIVERWERLEGVRMNLGRPDAGQRLMLDFDSRCIGDNTPRNPNGRIGMRAFATTDSKGHFVFDRVLPAGLELSEVEHSGKFGTGHCERPSNRAEQRWLMLSPGDGWSLAKYNRMRNCQRTWISRRARWS